MVDSDLLVYKETNDPSSARITVNANQQAGFVVEPKLFGKFCEHLGNNINQGMEAQILFNPTFGKWHFRGTERQPSGGFVSESDRERIEKRVRNHGRPLAYPPETDSDVLLEAYDNALAFGWQPIGDVLTSPDTGPNGNRAQRIQVGEVGEGVLQETRLPLHRVNEFDFRTQIRATQQTTVRISVGMDDVVHDESILDIGTEWNIYDGTLDISNVVDSDGIFEIALTADDTTDLIVERILLYPSDHVDYADSEVIELLLESNLPLLRWPGGNFVSGYDWRKGVGPVDERQECINQAWDGLEPNLFGTAEFITFCEHVGSEPLICINAGDGTPEEAAKWVEYCNGDPEKTEMGALRATHGYPDPFDVKYWEIGNELWGEWQVRWTTPKGNADRYRQFREAMLNTDPNILVTACGVVANDDQSWNQVLLKKCGADVRAISSHPLAGGEVDYDTDPNELYHAFMGYSKQLAEQYANVKKQMIKAGVEDPKLDVTELQLFANFNAKGEEVDREESDIPDDKGCRLTPGTMPTPTTISEAIYDACMRHDLIRLGEFAELLTHSATVNHGGGLQKEGERVWADPCHYGRLIGAAQIDATPITVGLECDSISTDNSFGDIQPVDVPSVDAMATIDNEMLRVVIVNRASRDDPVTVTLDLHGFEPANEATLTTLGGEKLYEENTRDEPERITPKVETITLNEDTTIELSSYSMTRIDMERS